jgi:acyl-CoA reductase-like NAD-dependent aldehyde dehydrogenase
MGSLPFMQNGRALVVNEPLRVVLGIAPWNSFIILDLHAVVAPVAAGIVVISKASDFLIYGYTGTLLTV